MIQIGQAGKKLMDAIAGNPYAGAQFQGQPGTQYMPERGYNFYHTAGQPLTPNNDLILPQATGTRFKILQATNWQWTEHGQAASSLCGDKLWASFNTQSAFNPKSAVPLEPGEEVYFGGGRGFEGVVLGIRSALDPQRMATMQFGSEFKAEWSTNLDRSQPQQKPMWSWEGRCSPGLAVPFDAAHSASSSLDQVFVDPPTGPGFAILGVGDNGYVTFASFARNALASGQYQQFWKELNNVLWARSFRRMYFEFIASIVGYPDNTKPPPLVGLATGMIIHFVQLGAASAPVWLDAAIVWRRLEYRAVTTDGYYRLEVPDNSWGDVVVPFFNLGDAGNSIQSIQCKHYACGGMV